MVEGCVGAGKTSFLYYIKYGYYHFVTHIKSTHKEMLLCINSDVSLRG